jgi:hypothetical protein
MRSVRPQSQHESSGQASGLLCLSFLTSILLRVPHYQHALTFVDEGFFASVATELLHGSVLYRDVWCNNQPLALYFCKCLFQLLGPTSVALHLGSLLLVFAETWLLYRIGGRFFSPRVGGLCALAYALASTGFYTPRIIGFTPEQLMIVCTTGAVYLSLHSLEREHTGAFFFVGLLSCAAILSKPAAVPEVLMFAVFPLFTARTSGHKIQALAWLACGYLSGISFLVLSLMPGGAMESWWRQSVIERLYYVGRIGWPAFLRDLAMQPLAFGAIYLWAWILIWHGRRGDYVNRTAFRFCLFWLAAACLGVMIGRRFYANYYIQVFPPVSLLAAVGLDQLLPAGPQVRPRAPLTISLVAFLLPFLWFQARTFAHYYYFIDAGAHRRATLWDMCVIDRQLREIAGEIRDLTRPEDRIFVCGPNPELYFLSGRRMATAFSTFDITDPAEPPYGDDEQRTIETLRNAPPLLIIDSLREVKMADEPGWRDLVAAHYRLYREEYGVRLFLRKDSPAVPGRTAKGRP